jgi:ABC-2 type transport system ATP-binding protein
MQSAPKNLADRKFADRPASGQPGGDPSLAICARDLSKHYRNPWTLKVTTGLDGLDLDLRCGEVLGYLGPNGAGKTTTLKLLAGLLKPTGGNAWLLGESIEEPRSRKRLGFLPEQPYFYDYLSGIEYLEMAGQLSGLGAQEAHRQAKHWLGRVGLGDRPSLRLRKYSKGMLQRMGLAAALVHGPELLILDEPMSGLDPFGRRDVRDLILEQKTRGVTVMFSSHILPDVELLCDRVAVVLRGRLSRVATVQEIVAGGSHRVEIAVQGLAVVEIPPAWRASMKFEQRASDQLFVIESDALLDEALAWLVRSGAHIKSVTPQRANLESLLVAASETDGGESERRLA